VQAWTFSPSPSPSRSSRCWPSSSKDWTGYDRGTLRPEGSRSVDAAGRPTGVIVTDANILGVIVATFVALVLIYALLRGERF
jgi:hypothetical protein